MKYKPILILLVLALLPFSTTAQSDKPMFFEEITDLPYDQVYAFQDGLARVICGNKYGYIDKGGTLIIPIQYDASGDFSEGLAPAKQNGKCGYIDKTGTFIIPVQYDNFGLFSEGLATVMQNGKCGYIDSTGKLIIPVQYDDAGGFSESLAPVKMNGKWGYIDKTGAILIPARFDFAGRFTEGMARVVQDAKWGYIDRTGTFMIPAQYDEAYVFTDDVARVKKNGKYGYIDRTGAFIIPTQYDEGYGFSDGFAAIKQKGKWGFVDKGGQLAIPCQYEAVGRLFRESIAPVKKDGKWRLIRIVYYNLSKYIDINLGTVESFFKKRGIEPLDENEVRLKIEREIAEWQKKSEFEPTEQWRERVNDETRPAKVREIAERINREYNEKVQEAHSEYKKKYETLLKRYCKMRSDAFAAQELVLRPYDADNETYLISTAEYGDILLPVPLSKAPAFKSNWDNIKKSVEAVFVPSGNDVALQSVKFDKYVYDSNTKADYAQVDIDYNFGALNVDNLNLNFDAIDTGTQTAPEVASVAPRTVTPEQKRIAVSNTSDVDIDIPEGTTNADNTFAVVIANGNYAHASKVVNAESDGRIMSQYLARTLGLPQRNITTQIDATYGQMVSAVDHLRDISEAYGKDEFNVIFYYVGHGLPDDNSRESYILPVDVDPRNIKICYPLETLYSELGSLGAKSVTVMIDACFSGANHGEGLLLPQSMGVTIKPKQNRPTGNMVVLSAAEGDETAFPYASQGHGLFTYWILKKLKESRGQVTLGELSDYVVDNVKKTSVIENRKRQTPTVATSPSLAASWRALPLISE